MFLPTKISRESAFWVVVHLSAGLALTCGMLFAGADNHSVPLVAYLASLTLGIWYSTRRFVFISNSTWFFLAYLALFYINPLVLGFLGEAQRDSIGVFKAETELLYHCLAIGGFHLFWAAREAFFGMPTREVKITGKSPFYVHSTRLAKVLYLLLGINVLAILLMMIDQGGLSGMLASGRQELQENRSVFSLTGVYLAYAGIPAYFLVFVHCRKHKWEIPLWIVALVFIDIVIFLAYRIRTYTIAHLMAVGSGWFFGPQVVHVRGTEIPEKPFMVSSAFRRALNLFAILIFAASFGILARFARGIFEPSANMGIEALDLKTSVVLTVQLGDLGYAPIVMRMIEMVPEQKEFLFGQSYWRLATAPIPGAIWPDKPEDTQWLVGKWLQPDVQGLTIPPGIIGDLYINFGLMGVLGMGVFGAIFGFIDRKMTFGNIAFAGSAFAVVFHFARGAFTTVMIVGVVIYVSTVLISRYVRVRGEGALSRAT